MEAVKDTSQAHPHLHGSKAGEGDFPKQMGGTDQMSPEHHLWAGSAQQGRTSGTSAAEVVPGTTLVKSKSSSLH